MVTGHVGLAMLAHSADRTVPLRVLVAAAFAPDVVQMLLKFARLGDPGGMRSHSIPAVLALAVASVLVYAVAFRRARGGLYVALVCAAHLPADYMTGSKPSWPGGPWIGLGLYAWPLLDLVLEGLLVGTGCMAWQRRPDGKRVVPARTAMSAFAFLLAAQLLFDLRQHLLNG